MADKNSVFFAYAGRDAALVSEIEKSVRRANSTQKRLEFRTWQANDVIGRPIAKPIYEEIENAKFVIADITYPNLNVVYEVGYAVGKRKRCLLVKQQNTNKDDKTFEMSGVFDTLGYFRYENYMDLSVRMLSELTDAKIDTRYAIERKTPVFVVEPGAYGDYVNAIYSSLRVDHLGPRTFSVAENGRLSATEAVQQVVSSVGIVCMLDGSDSEEALAHNVIALFTAGLGHGLLKDVRIFHPKNFKAPLDILDQSNEFSRVEDVKRIMRPFSSGVSKKVDALTVSNQHTDNALKAISIGSPAAENEEAELGRYFLDHEQYKTIERGEANLVVGRKGSGKTAAFIQIKNRKGNDARNLVIDLKPEGYQMEKLKESMLSHITPGARNHLVMAFWEYILYLEIASKLLSIDKEKHRFDGSRHKLYVELESLCEQGTADSDFSERLSYITTKITNEYQAKFAKNSDVTLSADEVAKLLYTHDLPKIKRAVASYLSLYRQIWVIFDNLDKGWSTLGISVEDISLLRGLIDASRKIERDITKTVDLHCVVFVRNDVYDRLVQNTADYGKEALVSLDWNDRDLLEELVKRRFIASGDFSLNATFNEIWNTRFCNLASSTPSFDFIIQRSLMRPRNIIKLIIKSTNYAINLNKAKVEESDIHKGFRDYSFDLVQEIEREMVDLDPRAKDLIWKFTGQYDNLDAEHVTLILMLSGLDESSAKSILELLIYVGFLGVRSDGKAYYIYDVNYKLNLLMSRMGVNPIFVVNPGFHPALEIKAGGGEI